MPVFIEKTVSLAGSIEIPSHLSRELRRADEFIKYGALAANEILDCSKTKEKIDSGDCGLFLGSSYGPMDTNFEVLDQVVRKEQTSPTLFSHSVFNAAAGYLARIFHLQGCALTITDFGFPFFLALQQAIITIESGQISSCIVLQIETFSDLLNDARKRYRKDEASQWPTGACAWLLTNKAINRHSLQINGLTLETSTTSPEDYLNFHERLDIGTNFFLLQSPLEAAQQITKTIQKTDKTSKEWPITITAPYGKILSTISL